MRVSGLWLNIKKGSNMFPPRMLVSVVKLINLLSVKLGSELSSQPRDLITTTSIGGYVANSISFSVVKLINLLSVKLGSEL